MNSSKFENYDFREKFNMKFENRLISFLDILGFSHIVKQEDYVLIEHLFNHINDIRISYENKNIVISNISDSIIISVPFEKNRIIEPLFLISLVTCRIQHELAIFEVLLEVPFQLGN